jgi:hypothetical protein
MRSQRSHMLCFKGVSKIRPLMIPIRPLKIVHLLPEVLLLQYPELDPDGCIGKVRG